MRWRWFDKILDKFFGFDKLATKEDIRKLEKALDDLLSTIKSKPGFD
jgi:hypothetical protein